MKINFNFHGSTYKAGLYKQDENKLLVSFKDKELRKQFGISLPFYVKNRTVAFDIQNRSHSDLFALNSSISKAIAEQCKDILKD
jgi:hypothetical protein